ncbi:MAG: restriction endonuclease subunit S [Legionella sp.]|jgi:type I restriction enzyme S subunit
MSFVWSWKRLGDYCIKIGSGATPKGGKESYHDNGPISLIRSQNVHNNGFSSSGLAFIDEVQAKKLNNVKVDAGDILLNITGDSVARVCVAPFKYIPARVNQHVAIIRPMPEIFDSRFLRYFLASAYQQNLMLALAAAGATRNALTKGMIEEFKVPCPPIKIQQNIADILSSLDDRISLLRETNNTLESLAQALFKSWFIDFDPVHAKAEGREPEGMDAETAALFPDSFDMSALGLVPKEWSVSSFLDTIHVIGGGTPKTSVPEYWNGDIPWFSVVDAPIKTDVFVMDTEKHITGLAIKNSSTKLLSEGTTIISARGTVGRLALVGKAMTMNQSCYGLVGKANDSFFTFYNTHHLVDSLKQNGHGSVFNTITRDTFASVSIVYPNEVIINKFESTLFPIMAKIKKHNELVNILSNVRDLLLPRLISGQLSLSEVEDMESVL